MAIDGDGFCFLIVMVGVIFGLGMCAGVGVCCWVDSKKKKDSQ